MTQTSQALFAGLVDDEAGNPVDVSYVGEAAYYVVNEDDFRRHIAAYDVDKQVLDLIRGQVEAHHDLAVEGMLQLLGQDDLFTKAAVDASIKNMDQVLGQALPPEARSWLGMLGFRIVIDVHGSVVQVVMPGQEAEDDE